MRATTVAAEAPTDISRKGCPRRAALEVVSPSNAVACSAPSSGQSEADDSLWLKGARLRE
jgi:hypothetical protein